MSKESVVNSTTVGQQRSTNWRRWFRRTDVHIAEYILMLIFFGGLIALLASLWFSFFQLLIQDGFSGNILARTTALQLGSLVVMGVAGFWLYARVTGQEMVQPELQARTSRRVFLTMWMIVAVCGLVGIASVAMMAFVSLLLGQTDATQAVVGIVIPALFAFATVGFGIAAVVKRSNRKLSMLAGVVVAGLMVLLFIANAIAVFIRKDSSSPARDSSGGSSLFKENCTYTRYRDGECTLSEYRDSLSERSSSSNTYRQSF